jgi:hypothetical protein
MISGVVMLVGGIMAMALMRPERETLRWANELRTTALRSV